MEERQRVVNTEVVGNMINTLFLLCKHLSLYDEQNKLVLAATSRFFQLLERSIDDAPELAIYVARHGFLIDGEFIQRNNANFQKFAYRMFEHGISSITFTPELSRHDLFTFLRLILRPSSESWEAGGICRELENRQVVGLIVGEMRENDFALKDQENTSTSDTFHRKSDLWDRFALAIYQNFTGTGDNFVLPDGMTSGSLANQVSKMLEGKSQEEKVDFVKEVGRFFSSLPHENVKLYRAAALDSLVDFVEQLSPELRQMFLQNVFNLNLKTDYTKDFISKLSDDLILEALKNVSMKKNYVPPVVLNLLGKLASSRGLMKKGSEQSPVDNETATKIKELFKQDEFEKYVPDKYRKALMKVLVSPELPTELTERLDVLKASLENETVDSQVTAITMQILEGDIDTNHLGGIEESIQDTLKFCLTVADYKSLVRISRQIIDKSTDSELFVPMRKTLESESFILKVLDDAKNLGKEKREYIIQLIVVIGTPFISYLLERLANENDRMLRFFYLTCLKKLGSSIVGAAGAWLNDERWFVLRNIIDLIREVDGRSLLPKIRRLVKHPHSKVKFEAIHTCLVFKDTSVVGILLKNIDSSEEETSLPAILLARYTDDERINSKLLDILGHQAFIGNYHFNVKRAVVRTLAEKAHPKVLPLFERILSSRDLFHGQDHAQLKLEIIKSLTKFPEEEVIDILEDHSRSTGESAKVAATLWDSLKEGPR